MTLKLTPLKHLRILAFILLLNISLLYFLIYISPSIKIVFIVFIPYFLIFAAPALYLHNNYDENNGNLVFTINNEGITKEENGVTTFYDKKDFKEMKCNMTAGRIAGLSKFFHDKYFFCTIVMNNNEEIIISSLYSSRVDSILKEHFREVPTNVINDFFPTIRNLS